MKGLGCVCNGLHDPQVQNSVHGQEWPPKLYRRLFASQTTRTTHYILAYLSLCR